MRVEAEDLLPKLPKPRDLQPFPTTLSLVFRGHSDIVRSISVDPTGQWFVSGSDDGYVKVMNPKRNGVVGMTVELLNRIFGRSLEVEGLT